MGNVLSSNRYVKPPGYRTILAPAGYKPFNGFLGGDKSYGPRLVTAQAYLFTFLDAPDDLSTITIFDGGASEVFTFTYGGAPGAGIIPLAVGGGTAAQAAAAALVVFQEQLSDWTSRAVSSVSTEIAAKEVGIFMSAARSDAVNVGLANSTPEIGNVLPARFGRNYGFLSAGAVFPPESS
jgi:hypothetical protein